MSQKLFTKRFGMIEVERSWQNDKHHIAKLTNGAYCYIDGLPIRDKSELSAVLTGEDLAAALEWFDHRHDEEEAPPRRILIEPDGTAVFEDGTPVESPSDLVQALKPGPMLDAALMILTRKLDAKNEAMKAVPQAEKPPKKKAAGKKKTSKNKAPAKAKGSQPRTSSSSAPASASPA